MIRAFRFCIVVTALASLAGCGSERDEWATTRGSYWPYGEPVPPMDTTPVDTGFSQWLGRSEPPAPVEPKKPRPSAK